MIVPTVWCRNILLGNRCCNLCLNLVSWLCALGCSSGSQWGLADWFLWAGVCREDIDFCKAGHIMSQEISSLIQVFRGIYEWSWGLCHHSPLLSVVLYRGQISLLHFSLQYFDISWKNRHCYLDSGRIFILSLAFYAAPPFSFSLPLPSFFPLCFGVPGCAWMCVSGRARQGWQIME